MISGHVVMEDIEVLYKDNSDLTVTYTVKQCLPSGNELVETFTVPQEVFFKALSIAVHNSGMPDYREDYPDAESIMGTIRWIP
jgi:hypothetical protein